MDKPRSFFNVFRSAARKFSPLYTYRQKNMKTSGAINLLTERTFEATFDGASHCPILPFLELILIRYRFRLVPSSAELNPSLVLISISIPFFVLDLHLEQYLLQYPRVYRSQESIMLPNTRTAAKRIQRGIL